MKLTHRTNRFLLTVLLVPLLMVNSCKDKQTEASTQKEKKEIGAPEVEVNVAADTISLSPVLPFDVTITGSVMETSIRRNFDEFSWESFIALNWSQDSTQVIGSNGDNPTLWETWKNSSDVFLANGAKPTPWGTLGTLPPGCSSHKGKFLSQVGKTPDLLNESELPFKTGPLIDQNSAYSRFEILVNQEMFEYIDDNNLYSFDGQQSFHKNAEFPEGNNDTKVWGAIMVKGAWKIMGENDDPNRFHTVDAVIYTPAQTDPVVAESCFTAKVGLVGLHIGTKTAICPQWIWSTFEQVDNAPTFGKENEKKHYNYFDVKEDRKVNEAPLRPWNPEIPDQIPTQVQRLTPIFSGTAELNKAYQAKLRSVNEKSVWQYYELVGTQWPTNSSNLPLGDPFPQFLGNATLETYIQGIIVNDTVQLVPNVSTSCMHCHNGATMISTGKTADFTFLLERAQ